MSVERFIDRLERILFVFYQRRAFRTIAFLDLFDFLGSIGHLDFVLARFFFRARLGREELAREVGEDIDGDLEDGES